MKDLLNNDTNWWLLWGIISPVFVLFSILSAIFINSFIMIIFELVLPAFFGLWVYDKENFKINSFKFAFLLIVVSILAVFLGKVFAWISAGIMLILFKVSTPLRKPIRGGSLSRATGNGVINRPYNFCLEKCCHSSLIEIRR